QRGECRQLGVVYLHVSGRIRPIRDFCFSGPKGLAEGDFAAQIDQLSLDQKVTSIEPRSLAIQAQRNINVIESGNCGRRLAEFYLCRRSEEHTSELQSR